MPVGPTVHVLDLKHLGRPRTIAAFLVVGPQGADGGAVLVETGPASSYENLLVAMSERGFGPADLRAALLTHIHLDHAGAAGRLAANPAFTGRIYVHEFGAPHLIDPSRLIDSANRIYGGEMERLWGTILPVPRERIVPLRDHDVIESAGLRFVVMATPGHARHHCCFSLATPRKPICFTGDAAGMIVPPDSDRLDAGREAQTTHHLPKDAPPGAGPVASRPFINLPTPPPEFDLELWLNSVNRIDHGRFGSLYLTHFGRVDTPDAHLVAVRRALRSHTAFIECRLRGRRPGDISENELATFHDYMEWVRRQARESGITPDEIAVFVTETLLRMNVVGIARYLRRRDQ